MNINLSSKLETRPNPSCRTYELPGNLMHDLMQPMNALGLVIEHLEELIGAPTSREVLLDQVRRLRAIVAIEERLLSSLRGYFHETGRVASKREEPAAASLLNLETSIKNFFCTEFPEVSLVTQGFEECWVESTVEDITAILRILAENAATHAASEVKMVAHEVPGASNLISIDVIDDGAGISPSTLGKLGMPFVREPKSQKRKRQGLGLGLFLAGKLCDRLGFYLAYSDLTENGCVFSLKVRKALKPRAGNSRNSAPSAPMRIVVADHRARTGERIAEFLSSIGHRVEVAKLQNGLEIREFLAKANAEVLVVCEKLWLEFNHPRALPVGGRHGVIVLSETSKEIPNADTPLAQSLTLKIMKYPVSPTRLRAAIGMLGAKNPENDQGLVDSTKHTTLSIT